MVFSICDVCMFFSKLPCNLGALLVMLRVVCVSKKTFLPFWGGFISPSLGQN